MVRAFTAVPIPEQISQKLSQTAKQINAGRPVKPEKMHITLEFFDHLNPEEREKVEEALNQINLEPFEIEVKGLGVFPSKNYIRVMWADVKSEKIFELNRHASQHSVKSDNDHEFRPHITLLRVDNVRKGDKKRLHQALEDYHDTSFGTFNAEEVNLYRSDLKPSGSKYSVLESRKL